MVEKSLKSFSQELNEIIPYIMRGALKSQSDALKKGIITIPQYLALDILNSHGLLKMKDIAKELNISFPAATGLINRLHRLRMVERIYDKKDRRLIYIQVTAKGKKTVESIRSQILKMVHELFGKLTDEERLNYLNIIRKIKKILYPETP